jgi:5-methylcytosine-specific restriction endonuclease McrA
MPTKRVRMSQFHRCIISSRQLWRCNHCNSLFGAIWHVDHIIPLCQDGSNDFENLQALCETCHTIKSSKETADRGRKRINEISDPTDEPVCKKRRVQ